MSETILLCNYIIVFFSMVYIHNETTKLHLDLLNIVYLSGIYDIHHMIQYDQILYDSDIVYSKWD